jgi:hypothetical protein
MTIPPVQDSPDCMKGKIDEFCHPFNLRVTVLEIARKVKVA